MHKTLLSFFVQIVTLLSLACSSQPEQDQHEEFLQISGVYPHLAVFNEGDGLPCNGNGNECGIGAIVPWAGKLWMLTYSPHCPHGSSDKLYTIDEQLTLEIRPESIGGTPANRMIHAESEQLILGPYFINAKGTVRGVSYDSMPGRHTATMRHLEDPEKWVYFFDMEGKLYEVNVNTLKVNKLFEKPVPGWHGKGAYTTQGRLVIANNGEHQVFDIDTTLLQAGGAPQNEEEMGALASWNGEIWEIVERKQFTEVTGPGGIYGAQSDDEPLWSIGWDKRSVILKLLDEGTWYTYRLPKATHTYDHWGGWYTEWPRIREINDGRMLMHMHGMFYEFPKDFDSEHTGGIAPIANHLRYVPDFCHWNGRLVIATDETSILQNPYAGRSQSNLWFGQLEDMQEWGPENGWGGPWVNDSVEAGEPSVPFLINAFEKKVLHLAHDAPQEVAFTLEIDERGNNAWETFTTVNVPENGYQYYIFPEDFAAQWVRIKANKNCTASAFFHYQAQGHAPETWETMFAGLAGIDDAGEITAGLVRPAAHNKNLQYLHLSANDTATYYEVDEQLHFLQPEQDRSEEVREICALKKEFETDEASVIVSDETGTYRLPKTSVKYDEPFTVGWPRGKREVESERYMFNAHGTFYEIPREAGLSAIRPVTTHKRQIVDFCTWRGLLVLSGNAQQAENDGHYFGAANGNTGLWFGAIDDLWKLGKPVGQGGPWKNTSVQANTPSLPYLMTGYDQKKVELTSDQDAVFTLEVNFDHQGWHTYDQMEVKAGETITHRFPEGFNAHWLRVTADKDCMATAWLVYE